MSVLKLFPHTLSYMIDGEGYRDEDGNYHPSEGKWIEYIRCDAVPSNGEASIITLPDGTQAVYRYVVYLPKNCKDFAKGDKVRIRLYDKVNYEFVVKGFHRYQLQCKLWV